jgi:hypothetical protein
MNISEAELIQCDKNYIASQLQTIKVSRAYFMKKLKTNSPFTNKEKLKSRLKQLDKFESQYNFMNNLLIIDANFNFAILKKISNYAVYTFQIFEKALNDLLIGVIIKILNNETFYNLLSDYIKNNKYSSRYQLTPYNYLLAYTIDKYIEIGYSNALEYIISKCNISKIPKPVALNFVQCSIKYGKKDIYDCLMKHFKLDISDIEITYSTSLLFEEKDISQHLDTNFPILKDKPVYKLRRSISNEKDIDTEHTSKELEVANILANLYCYGQ